MFQCFALNELALPNVEQLAAAPVSWLPPKGEAGRSPFLLDRSNPEKDKKKTHETDPTTYLLPKALETASIFT